MRVHGIKHGKVALKIIAENSTDVAILSAFTDSSLENHYIVGSSYSSDKSGVDEVWVLQCEKRNDL